MRRVIDDIYNHVCTCTSAVTDYHLQLHQFVHLQSRFVITDLISRSAVGDMSMNSGLAESW